MDETADDCGGLGDDSESGTYRTTYDNDRDRPSIALVNAIAAMKGVEPTALDPLGGAIALDPLDSLLQSTDDGCVIRTTIPSHGVRISVDSGGTIELRPTDSDLPDTHAEGE